MALVPFAKIVMVVMMMIKGQQYVPTSEAWQKHISLTL